jgi:hypothetical protein
MKTDAQATELMTLNTIRVETVISRYPVHCLARNKSGGLKIDITEQNESGETILKWKVSTSTDYGQPGPLAYKLDTLVINRRIEEARPRVPRLIRLGSLSDLCKELGLADSGKNRADIKNALFQNAFAGIVPYLRWKQADGSEDTLETAFNRYAIILTGKKLPDGRKADGVYILLSDVYLNVLNGAMTRPLDYDYLRSLPPAPQRFYELLSYQMYAALKYDRPRAKLTYSALCSHAPQKRYTVWKRVRSQMTSVHRKHLESGYIADVDYQESIDKDGLPDWIMHYKPGPKARAEFRASMKRGGPTLLEIEPFEPEFTPIPVEPLLLENRPATPSLVVELVRRGVSESTAVELVQRHPAETIQAKIDILDWLVSTLDKRVSKSPAGYLVKSIVDDYARPKGYSSVAERQQREETKQARERQATEERRQKQQEEARAQAEQKALDALFNQLPPEEQARVDSEALAEAGEDAQNTYATLKRMTGGGVGYLAGLRRDYLRRHLQAEGKPILADA